MGPSQQFTCQRPHGESARLILTQTVTPTPDMPHFRAAQISPLSWPCIPMKTSWSLGFGFGQGHSQRQKGYVLHRAAVSMGPGSALTLAVSPAAAYLSNPSPNLDRWQCHTPLLCAYPTGCHVEEDVVLGCHAGLTLTLALTLALIMTLTLTLTLLNAALTGGAHVLISLSKPNAKRKSKPISNHDPNPNLVLIVS